MGEFIETSPVTLLSPLNQSSDDFLRGLIFRSMSASEALGRPFEYRLELLSQDDSLSLSDLLAKPVTVRFEKNSFETRYFNGIVTDFALIGSAGNFALYEATVRPWLWLLTQTINCRIFQNLSVPDIVSEVCRRHGFTDIDSTALTGAYLEREFVVQYAESDFNFISRLLEEEGIYYFFTHEADKHTLVLADDMSAHETQPGVEELPFRPPDPNRIVTEEHIDSWKTQRRVVSDAYAVKDFDFERPAASLLSPANPPDDERLEIFEYAKSYAYSKAQEQELLKHHNEDPRDTYVRVRLEELESMAERAVGRTNARGLLVGALFTLTDFPRDDQNRRYLVTSARYELRGTNLESGQLSEQLYQCTFEVQDAARNFRPRTTTRKPTVLGPQTAIVVGKQGEEIWTDEYGRVKVLFPWDRYGSGVEDSSCWVRVAQIWAGSKFGGIFIPRIGQEVIVEFLEGDPDRPIITGRVYNADNMPPYALPANATQSGIKTRSSKGGHDDNHNEIRFEDKKGSEELYFHAEKNHTTKVKASRSASIGGSDSVSVGGNRTESITGNLSISVDGAGGGDVQSQLSVNGVHRVNTKFTEMFSTEDTSIMAKNFAGIAQLKYDVSAKTIKLIAAERIELIVAGTSIVIDQSVIELKTATGCLIRLDGNSFVKANGGASVLLKDDVLAKGNGGAELYLQSEAKLTGSKAKVTGGQTKLELSGEGKLESPGTVTVTGSQVKLNS